MAKVSVIVPVFNAQRYLHACLKSLIRQTLYDIEIICVDDGSSDNSPDVLNYYAEKDGRIKIISKTNSGYGAAMNTGMANATGEYIGIVEADDFVDRRMFYDLYRTAKRTDADIVKSDYYEFFKNGKEKYIRTPTHPVFYNRVISAYDTNEIYHFRMNTWTGIYKSSFLNDLNIRHNETPGASYQDNGFWFKTLSLAGRMVFVNKAYYHYRQDNPDSSINSKDKVFCMCEEYEYIRRFLDEYPDIKKAHLEVFLAKKYYNYLYTYRRIRDKYKIDFLKRFSFEFCESKKNSEFSKNMLPDGDMKILERIMEDPVQFYFEDMTQELNRKYFDLSNKFAMIGTLKAGER